MRAEYSILCSPNILFQRFLLQTGTVHVKHFKKTKQQSHLFELLEDGNIFNSTSTYTTLQTKELEDVKNLLEIERKATTTPASIA